MSKIDRALYARTLECLIEDFDGLCTISDFGIVVNGTQIDHLMVCDTLEDGGCGIKFIWRKIQQMKRLMVIAMKSF